MGSIKSQSFDIRSSKKTFILSILLPFLSSCIGLSKMDGASLVEERIPPRRAPGSAGGTGNSAAFNAFYAVIQKNCNQCHFAGSPSGDFVSLKTQLDWELSPYLIKGNANDSKVYYYLIGSEGANVPKNMPKNAAALKISDRNLIRDFINRIPAQVNATNCDAVPIFSTKFRRLSNREYDNTVRDLTGISGNHSLGFPQDPVDANGFDNQATQLSLSETYLEKALITAEDLSLRLLSTASTSTRLVISCDLAASSCMRTVIQSFGDRAFRRPMTIAELDGISALAAIGIQNNPTPRFGMTTAKEGLAVALQAILISPQFLMRMELDPSIGTARALNAYEIASRLSYFLWSTMPDATLFELAKSGSLAQNLPAQIDRMIADPKIKAFVENFGGNWLGLSRLSAVQPASSLFGAFGDQIRADLKSETLKLLEDVLLTQKSVKTLIDADYSYLNSSLASHYGLSPVAGTQLVKTPIPADKERRGLFGHGSILAMTSNSDRTSPTKRGYWVLDKLLCDPPMDSPPGAGMIDQTIIPQNASFKQIMQAHRANVNCISCHTNMDPIGFGLDRFDSVGKYRIVDHLGKALETSDSVFSAAFSNSIDLGNIVKNHKNYNKCIAKKVYQYALQSDASTYSNCSVQRLSEVMASGKDNFKDLIKEIVVSDGFMKKKSQ